MSGVYLWPHVPGGPEGSFYMEQSGDCESQIALEYGLDGVPERNKRSRGSGHKKLINHPIASDG